MPAGMVLSPNDISDRLIHAHVGLIVRQRRKALGVSQARLAEAVGVSFQQIQKYERGTNRISASMMWRLARVLRCAPGDLFAGLPDDERRGAEESADGSGVVMRDLFAVHGGVELAQLYLSLATPLRRALLAAGRALAK